MTATVQAYESRQAAIGQEAIGLIRSEGLEQTDFKGGKAGCVSYFYKLVAGNFDEPTATVRKGAQDSAAWVTKTSPRKATIGSICPRLMQLLQDILNRFDQDYSYYLSARMLSDNLYQLGILNDLYQEVRAYCDEKGLMLLSDTTHILNMLIADVKEGKDRRTVTLCCVPPEHAFDTAEWHDRYIHYNEDNLLLLGRGLTSDITINIDKTPHILIGGNTGSGKTILLQCLLWQAIEQADVVYVADFKGGVDFPRAWQEFAYIITNEQKLLVLLNRLADTLEKRKQLFKEVEAANITEYRQKAGDYMQRIVFACDEVAELLDRTGADKERKELLAQIEARLALIARQGRAFGVHLILATQRPDANILSGQIKNNMNIRICGRADTTLSTIIIGDGRAAEQIPHDAQGRFLMEDGTVFQAYYFNDATLK